MKNEYLSIKKISTGDDKVKVGVPSQYGLIARSESVQVIERSG